MEERGNWHEHFVNFDISVQWQLSYNQSASGTFQVICPESFPLACHKLKFPIRNNELSCSQTLDTCVDDFFIDCAFRNSFVFKLRYHQSKHKKSDSQAEDTVLLDASVLFIKNRREASVSCKLNSFEKVIFSVRIDDELLSESHVERFCPTILYLSTIENLPHRDDYYAPLFLTCKIGDKKFNVKPTEIRGTTCTIDTAIVIAPRVDTPVVFEIHDRDLSLPAVDSFRGSGLYSHFTPVLPKEEPQGPEPEPTTEDLKREEPVEKKHKKKHHSHHKKGTEESQPEPESEPEIPKEEKKQPVPFIQASQPRPPVRKPEPEPPRDRKSVV